VRVTALVVAVAFGWRVSLAYAMPCDYERPAGASESTQAAGDGCCPHAKTTDGDSTGVASSLCEDADDEGDCPCPIDCSPCCGGAVMHAIPALPLPAPARLAVFAVLPDRGPPSRHTPGAPHDILHVPR
jgi:hypothetical protein